MRSLVLVAAAALSACTGPGPIEVDGDHIRALLARVAMGDEKAGTELVGLAGRSGEARSLTMQEAERFRKVAEQRADAERNEEARISIVGRALTEEEKARLAEAVAVRAENERAAEALAKLLDALH